jgi:hypothetical protein
MSEEIAEEANREKRGKAGKKDVLQGVRSE